MMKSAIALLISTLLTVDAATRVAVVELGASGTVRRTTSSSEAASVDGVASFWSALHGYGRKLQHAGMPMVPDLFKRPESGVVIGLTGSGIDLDHMPTLEGLLEPQENNNVVGHLQLKGHQCKKMMENVPDKKDYGSEASLKSAFDVQAKQAGISGLQFDVSAANAADFDAQLSALLKGYSGSETVIVHLVVEEEDGAARRRVLASTLEGEQESSSEGNMATSQRRLQEDEEEGEGEGEGEGSEDQGANNGYYGYGYYNAYGEWVTPYKTMFQIQYFNVVLWTSLGLVAVLFFSIYLMIYMPLMADTLLFGESARVAHDD